MKINWISVKKEKVLKKKLDYNQYIIRLFANRHWEVFWFYLNGNLLIFHAFASAN